MRPIEFGLAVLVGLSAFEADAIAGQMPDALTAHASNPSTRVARPGDAFVAGSSFPSRLITALAGGALGAGLGFFASQIVTGDWDERQIDRAAWAAVGGSIGIALGVSFPLGGRPAVSRPRVGLPLQPPITADEMSGTGVHSAHDAVELLRPQWLTQRGFQIIGERPSDRVQVYLDDMHLGGIEKLSDVSAFDLASIHFLDAAAATYRWGAGHNHGAIMMISEGDDSD